MAESIWDILSANTAERAIGAPGRRWLDGAGLRSLAEQTRAALNGAGIGRGDRVGIVLPNGPEMATCFTAVAAACTAAPLNPAYTADELDFYLSDLAPRAVVLPAGVAVPARAVAERLAIPVIELHPEADGPAGLYRLDVTGLPDAAAQGPGAAGPDDMALVLHTSGTTARPKIVPLTNRNLAASATHVAQSLALSPSDVCLNVMPLFHIHGLVAAVLSSLHAGAGVSCTPGFNAFKFGSDSKWLLRGVGFALA